VCVINQVQYGDSADNTAEENSDVFSLMPLPFTVVLQ